MNLKKSRKIKHMTTIKKKLFQRMTEFIKNSFLLHFMRFLMVMLALQTELLYREPVCPPKGLTQHTT